MHFNAASIALGVAVTAVAATNSTVCHDYVLISIRGTYELQGPSIGFKGMINSTLLAIPGGIEYDAVYPAAANQTSYLGAEDVVAYIDSGLVSCPKQRYAILGYSQGAAATSQTLYNYTDPSSAGYKAIKAVLVIGNPVHHPNATLNVDQDGGDTTRQYPGSEYNPAHNTSLGIPPIYYTNGELLDICYDADIVCAPAYPNSSFTSHLKYGSTQSVQDMGAKFLISRLGGNSTSSAVSSGILPSGSGGLYPTGSGALYPTGTGGVVPSSTGGVATGTGSSTKTGPTAPAGSTSAISTSDSSSVLPGGVSTMFLGVLAVLTVLSI